MRGDLCGRVPACALQVFIYGGAYISGSVSLGVYAGEPMVATGNVVVVEVQYRLGVLGYVQPP